MLELRTINSSLASDSTLKADTAYPKALML